MTQTYWPITGQPMANDQWAVLAREFGTPGVATGLLPFRTAGGLFVPAGDAVSVKGTVYRNTTDVQITVPLNSGGSSRNDLLVLRHDFAVAPEPRLVYVTGGTTAPVATVATDVPLGVCLVPSGSAVPLTVTDARTFTGLSLVPCRTVADIPTDLLREGLPAWETTTSRLRVRSGSGWANAVIATDPTVYTPTWVSTTGATNVGAGGEIRGEYTRLGNVVHWTFNLYMGTTGLTGGPGSGLWHFTLPTGARLPSARQNLVGVAHVLRTGVWAPAGTAHRHAQLANAFVVVLGGTNSQIGTGVPGGWAAGDEIRVTGTYVAV